MADMKSFEDYVEEEIAMEKARTFTDKVHRIKRTLTRMEWKRNRTRFALMMATIVWMVLIVALLAYTAVMCSAVGEDTTTSSLPSDSTEEAVVEDFDEATEENENELIEAALLSRAHKIENCTISHYCTELRPHICGTGDGITASGRMVQAGVSCAVDPDVIPLGSTVMVDYGDGELHYYVADDVGAWVNGNHIDLAVSGHQEAMELGMKTATVYWCEEE